MFCRSSTKKCKFQEIADASECKSIAFRPLNEVRWLSRHFALHAIIQNYKPLFRYFEEDKDNDPISKYCYKTLGIENIRLLSLQYKHFLQEESVIIQQYNDFKFLVTEKIKSKLINGFPGMTMFAFQISLQN